MMTHITADPPSLAVLPLLAVLWYRWQPETGGCEEDLLLDGWRTFGPIEMRVLSLGVPAAERSVHYFGLSEVRGLPLGVAAERSVHYFWDYFSFLSFLCHILFSQKGLS